MVRRNAYETWLATSSRGHNSNGVLRDYITQALEGLKSKVDNSADIKYSKKEPRTFCSSFDLYPNIRNDIKNQLGVYFINSKEKIACDFVAVAGENIYVVDGGINDDDITFKVVGIIEFSIENIALKYKGEIKNDIRRTGGFYNLTIKELRRRAFNVIGSWEQALRRGLIQNTKGQSRDNSRRIYGSIIKGKGGGIKYSKHIDDKDVSNAKITTATITTIILSPYQNLY